MRLYLRTDGKGSLNKTHFMGISDRLGCIQLVIPIDNELIIQ